MKRLPAALALAVAATSCGDGLAPVLELAEARTRWTQSTPAIYRYTIQISCFCVSEVLRPVEIQIINGVVTSRTFIDTNEAVPPQYEEAFPTIDGLFDVIAEAIDQDAETLRASYDPLYGYPVSIGIDYRERIADDEISYTVRNFTAATP